MRDNRFSCIVLNIVIVNKFFYCYCGCLFGFFVWNWNINVHVRVVLVQDRGVCGHTITHQPIPPRLQRTQAFGTVLPCHLPKAFEIQLRVCPISRDPLVPLGYAILGGFPEAVLLRVGFAPAGASGLGAAGTGFLTVTESCAI